MRISVGEAIASNRLTGVKLVAGRAGLHRVVKRLSLLKVLDPEQVEQGELALLDLVPEEDALAHFLISASERNPAAFLIRSRLSTDRICEVAEAHDLPLLQLGDEGSWQRIVASVQRDLLLTQIELYERVQEIHASLTRAVVRGQGLKEIARVLAELVGNPVVIENERYEVLAADNSNGIPDVVRERVVGEQRVPADVLAVLAREGVLARINSQQTAFRVAPIPELDMQARVMAPIRVGSIRYGHISIQESNQPLGELELMAVEQAAALAALHFSLRRLVREREQRLEENLVFDLLFGDKQDEAVIIQRASFLGHVLADRHAVVVVDVDDFAAEMEARQWSEQEVQDLKDGIRQQIRGSLKQRKRSTPVAGSGDSTIILFPLAEEESMDSVRGFARHLQAQLSTVNRDLTFSIGIGRFCDAMGDLGQSYQDAQTALTVGKRMGEEQSILAYDELGIYSLFANYKDAALLGNYLERTVGRLKEYDREHNAELLKTLRSYFRNGFNKQQAADELFVHVNTVSYRLRRVEQLTGLEISNADDLLELQLALKIAAMKRLRAEG